MAKIVTITNPLTGQPAQVDQLDHTAQQIDDGLNIARGVSNPNLLDNWYFGNPVDQRGGYVVPPGTTYYYAGSGTVAGTTVAYYTVKSIDTSGNATFSIDGTDYWCNGKGVRGYTGEVYGIDRWIAQWTGDGVTLIEDGCISIYRASHDSHICQRITDDLGGQTVTVSAICKGTCTIKLDECDSGWVFKSSLAESAAVSSNDYTLITATGVVPQGCKNLIAEIVSASGVKSQFKAAKLELGTQQTLAHQENGVWVLNEIPDYGEQLARCQRYFQLYSSADLRPAKAVDCRPVMRADPAQSTIVVNSTTYYYNTADL